MKKRFVGLVLILAIAGCVQGPLFCEEERESGIGGTGYCQPDIAAVSHEGVTTAVDQLDSVR